MEQRVKRIMSDILELDALAIHDGTSMDTTQSWDSLAHINLVSAIEQEFEIELNVEEIESMRSYNSIVQLLNQRLSLRRS